MLTNWKTVAVFLDDSPQGAKIGECAVEFAHRCGAHLIGIHVSIAILSSSVTLTRLDCQKAGRRNGF